MGKIVLREDCQIFVKRKKQYLLLGQPVLYGKKSMEFQWLKLQKVNYGNETKKSHHH